MAFSAASFVLLFKKGYLKATNKNAQRATFLWEKHFHPRMLQEIFEAYFADKTPTIGNLGPCALRNLGLFHTLLGIAFLFQ